MFSTTPSTRSPVCWQKLSSLRTSDMATSCGVVTTTAPSRGPSGLDNPAPVALSSISTRHVRGTRARVDVDAVSSRVILEWRSWSDLEADWVATLSYGVLYIPSADLAIDTRFVVIAHLPDGRKALLSGRVGPQVRGITCLELSMGEQTRGLFTTRVASARVPVGR